ncbi:hypothetical protein [Bacterioplanoides sp.]|uniref:hypothetical protein n=1 Tax=Bacterioplanoides sp. TaxID=2066072 RepID=UPI003B5CDE15
MNTCNKRIFDTKGFLHLIQTVEFTVKSVNPEADACDVYDTLIMAASAMGADIARHAESPENAAKQFGDALTGNILNMLRVGKQ